MKILLGMLCLLLSLNSFAISETNYKKNFIFKVIPFMAQMKDGNMKSSGLNIHYKTLINKIEKEPSCLVILPGRSESAEKYSEFVYDLSQTEFGKKTSYFILDHRGQGSSERMSSPSDLGNIDHFDNYVDDLSNFLNQVVDKASCKKKFLFAHSLGAGIGLAFSIDHPDYFNAVAISSPMLLIQTKPYPYLVAKSIVTSMVLAGQGDKFALGQSGFDSNSKFEDNKFTTSEARFQMTMDLFSLFPKTKLGGVSNRWIYEVMNGTARIRQHYKKITAPIAMYRAGIELYSEPNEMHKFCLEVPNCQEQVMLTSKHEVVNDRDENRDVVIKSILEFFQKY